MRFNYDIAHSRREQMLTLEQDKELQALENDVSREAMHRYNDSMKALAQVIRAYEEQDSSVQRV